MINTLSEINTESNEGKLLMAALATLTTQPNLTLFGEAKRGSAMTPEEKRAKESFEKYYLKK